MDVKADDWDSLHKSEWAKVPELNAFINSFQFCNSVIEVRHETCNIVASSNTCMGNTFNQISRNAWERQ